MAEKPLPSRDMPDDNLEAQDNNTSSQQDTARLDFSRIYCYLQLSSAIHLTFFSAALIPLCQLHPIQDDQAPVSLGAGFLNAAGNSAQMSSVKAQRPEAETVRGKKE